MKRCVDAAVNALVAIYLTKGVQPGELTDNIFDAEYKSFSIAKKANGVVTLTLSYDEQGEESLQTVTCQYTYDENRTLLLIQQKIGSGRQSTLWCRSEAIAAAVDNLAIALAASGYSKARISALMLSMPLDLSPQIQASLKLVA
ncbi:hypothetical protein PSE10B_02210 [Pseudomonas amygdali pv. eriobotryae]|uniref:hypothetical protein n=1 Tax=Pseudomonas amygdali TaxID=47877 RepID=UPI0016757F57|nr:hypothetical protein [Pseudomonas amygdali]GFZ63699.1 hypothetical protein PSE10B_02210 [Pseudomonas amygdali pv. eriobotryae]